MVTHLTNGKEYMSIDTDNKRFTIERVCPVEDYEFMNDYDFLLKRRELLRNDEYKMRWLLPKKLQTAVITDEEHDGFRIPKRNNRNSKMRYAAHRHFA